MCKLSLASVNWHQHEIEYVESIIRTDIHILRGILNARQKRTHGGYGWSEVDLKFDNILI